MLTTADAAAALGVSAVRVRQLIAAGRLRAERLGRDWLIDEAALEAVRVRRPGRPRHEAAPSSGAGRARSGAASMASST